MARRKAQPDELLTALETAVKAVLASEDVTTSQRIDAIEAGAKLLAIRHKIGDGDGGSSFFPQPG